MNTLFWGILVNVLESVESVSENGWVAILITIITAIFGGGGCSIYKKWKGGKKITEKDIEKVVEKSYEVVDKIESIKKKHEKKCDGKKKE